MGISENMEEYLEALWILEKEKGLELPKINEIAQALKVAPPSAVEMLKKMSRKDLVKYYPRKGVILSETGKKIAMRIVRNHRLSELLLTDILDVKFNEDVHEEAICGLEHHISEDIADAVCTKLGHPRQCPHGHPIPKGKCCP